MKEKMLSKHTLNRLLLDNIYPMIEEQYQKKTNTYIEQLNLKNKIIL